MRITGWFDLFAGMMLVSTTAVVMAGLIGLTLRRRASVRHAVWLCALTVVLLSPALAWTGRALPPPPIAWPHVDAAVEPTARPAERPTSAPPAVPSPIVAVEPLAPAREFAPRAGVDRGRPPKLAPMEPRPIFAPAAVAASPPRSRSVRGAAVAVWLLGALGLLIRLVSGFRGVARLRKTARPFACESVRPRVASPLGVIVDRLPAIGVSDRTGQPLTIGVISPSVLIPEGLAESLPADAMRDVLIHECAHALRRDTVVGLLQRLAAIVCWPNPLVLLMNRALESAREELCDNHVLRASSPADYATSLLAVAERRPFAADLDAMLGLPMIARRGTLESRIAALIDPRRHAETSTRRGAVAALAVVFLTAGAAASTVRFEEAEQPPAVASSKPLDPTKTRIEGVVVDEAGKPAGDVLVRSWSLWGASPATRTGADGRFVLDVDVQSWPPTSLLASNADGSLQAIERGAGLYLYSIDRIVKASLVLKAARSTVVRVTDLRGDPVADAAVEIDNDFAPWWQGRTDGNGEARFLIPADVKARTVFAFKSGMGFDSLEDEEFWPGLEAQFLSEFDSWPGIESKRLPAEVDLVLDGATTVKIQAVDSANRPMPGVTFVPSDFWKAGRRSCVSLGRSQLARVTTDHEGVAVFDFIPKDQRRLVHFSVPSKTLCIADSTRFDPGKPRATLTMRVARTVPASGRVFKADGTPAPAIMVLAAGTDLTDRAYGYGFHATRTGADGSYHLDLYPDQLYLIGVHDDQWAARSRGGVLPREGSTIQGVDFHLTSGTLIKGRVTNATDHTPVAGRAVRLFEQGDGMKHPSYYSGDAPFPRHDPTETLIRRTRTDRDGRYAFRVGPGRFVPPDKDSDFTPLIKVVEHAEYAPDLQIKLRREPDVDFNFEVQSGERGPFVVTVRGPGGNGALVPHAYIAASESNPEGSLLLSPFEARADARGRLEARRTNAIKHLFARSADGSLGGFGTVGPEDEAVTIVLDEATTIRGRMIAKDGSPAPHARLDCYLVGPLVVDGRGRRDESRAPSNRDCVQIVIRSDAQGRYALSGLPVGTRVYLDQIVGRPDDQSRSVELEVKDLSPIAAPDVVAKTPSA